MNEEYLQNTSPEAVPEQSVPTPPEAPVPPAPTAPPVPPVPPAPTAPPVPPAPPAPTAQPTPPTYGTPVPPAYPPTYYPVQPPKQNNGLAIAALVCGIVSVAFCCCDFLSILTGIAAIVLAICSRKNGEKMSGLALAGLICGIVGAALGLIMLVFSLANLSGSYDFLTELENELSNELYSDDFYF